MNPIAKGLIVAGGVLIVAGVVWQLAAKLGISLGRLPGDIVVDRPGMKFYFPIVTCLLISGILSLTGWIVRWFQQR
jgi:hypothetical protein